MEQSTVCQDNKTGQSAAVGRSYTTYSMANKYPNKYRDDFFVQVRASELSLAREKVELLVRQKFEVYELLLSGANLSAGAAVSFLCGGFKSDQLSSMVVLMLMLASTGLCGSHWWTRRSASLLNHTLVAQELLRVLPDPNATDFVQDHYETDNANVANLGMRLSRVPQQDEEGNRV
ncbi:MAG: hypothetical protein FD169_517 [Bacillota bacterium]|nr:MAG: hypothetical protein FD169_517 [Bacillota bacterium]